MISTLPFIKKDIQLLNVSSPAFSKNTYIPTKYTCDGENTNPPIEIDNIPDETKCLVLIVEDPDAPIRTWIHWLVWNIPPTKRIKEDSKMGIEGINDFGQFNYGGPCPLSGTHQYRFKVYALSSLIYLNRKSTKLELEKAMSSYIIAFGDLIGFYKKIES